LTKEEKKKIYAFVASEAKGKVPCVAGIGGNNTLEVTQTLSEFSSQGYEAILSVSPYYNKPNQEGIFQHYMQLEKVSPLPIIIYNVPGRTGSNISAHTTIRLAKASSKFIATKEASGNAEQFMDILKDAPPHFSVISGDDNLTLPFLSMGMTGVISVIANAFPKKLSSIVQLGLEGKFSEARKIHFELYDSMKTIFADGSPGGIKVMLNQLGICENNVRLPLHTVNAEVEEKLRKLTVQLSA
jgi:4-hydroxy-tetrahydrodipicolinate synthase